MELIAKALVIAMGAAALLFGIYVGLRTAKDPVWFVEWHNRLNGDPRDYPSEWREQWWARWNLMMRDPDLVRSSPSRLRELRAFGVAMVLISAVLLLGLIAFAAGH